MPARSSSGAKKAPVPPARNRQYSGPSQVNVTRAMRPARPRWANHSQYSSCWRWNTGTGSASEPSVTRRSGRLPNSRGRSVSAARQRSRSGSSASSNHFSMGRGKASHATAWVSARPGVVSARGS